MTKENEVCVQRRVVMCFELVKAQSFKKNVILSRSFDSNFTNGNSCFVVHLQDVIVLVAHYELSHNNL